MDRKKTVHFAWLDEPEQVRYEEDTSDPPGRFVAGSALRRKMRK
jgi:hypothetical protein